MKKASVTLILIMIFLMAPVLLNAKEKKCRVGIGVSLGKEYMWFGSSNVFPTFYVPIDISSKFRLEPEIGFNLYSESFGIWDEPSSIIYLGCGIFAMSQKEKVNIYYGARTGLIFTSYNWNGSRTDFYVGPVTGGEYFLTKNFSLGGEIQVSYIFISLIRGEDRASQLKTKTLIFVRWYF